MKTYAETIPVVHRFDGTDVSCHSIAAEATSELITIEEAEHQLFDTFHTNKAPAPDRTERLVSRLGATAQLEQIVSEVIDDPQRLASIAAVSEKHPLGFYKIPLLWSKDPLYQLRLNLWPSLEDLAELDDKIDEANDGEDVHNHKFDFSSRVVLGRVDTWLYDFPEEGPVRYGSIPVALAAQERDPAEAERSLQWHYRQIQRQFDNLPEEYDPKPALVFKADPRHTGNEAMTFEGPGFIQLVPGHVILEAGDTYSLSHKTFHKAHQVSNKETTATLFLRGGTVVTSDTIARAPSKHAVDTNRPKIRLTEQMVAQTLGIVLRKLP